MDPPAADPGPAKAEGQQSELPTLFVKFLSFQWWFRSPDYIA
jgi:hypothetical protein